MILDAGIALFKVCVVRNHWIQYGGVRHRATQSALPQNTYGGAALCCPTQPHMRPDSVAVDFLIIQKHASLVSNAKLWFLIYQSLRVAVL